MPKGPIPADSQPTEVIHQSLAEGRSRRIGVRPPQRFGYEDMVGYALQVAEEEVDMSELSTYKEAISGCEAAQWFAAMGDEMESLHKNHTWELVLLPSGRKVIT